MHIDWASLGEVAVVSIAVAVVVIFTLGVLALSHRETDIERGGNGSVALTGALLCFAACAAVVLYSIYLIVPSYITNPASRDRGQFPFHYFSAAGMNSPIFRR